MKKLLILIYICICLPRGIWFYWTSKKAVVFAQSPPSELEKESIAKDLIVSLNSTARCQPGKPVYGWLVEQTNIYGIGINSSNGGFGLFTLGGSIRLGELTNPLPIRHALKINVWAEKYLHFDYQQIVARYFFY